MTWRYCCFHASNTQPSHYMYSTDTVCWEMAVASRAVHSAHSSSGTTTSCSCWTGKIVENTASPSNSFNGTYTIVSMPASICGCVKVVHVVVFSWYSIGGQLWMWKVDSTSYFLGSEFRRGIWTHLRVNKFIVYHENMIRKQNIHSTCLVVNMRLKVYSYAQGRGKFHLSGGNANADANANAHAMYGCTMGTTFGCDYGSANCCWLWSMMCRFVVTVCWVVLLTS